MRTNYKVGIWTLCLPLLLASCASKKALQKETTVQSQTQSAATTSQDPAVQKLSFVQKVSDNQVYAKNITGSMSFNLQAGSKDITVPGSLKMRKDEVIRIQLMIPILGTEVGRLEFTPDYVLIIDRIHKEYIKADYSQVDFLKKQGITFYSLQSLFWNQLLLPGTEKVQESDLKRFDADLSGTGGSVPVTYNNGNMTYKWLADRTTGRINQANVQYKDASAGTSLLSLTYDNFKSVGVKSFPANLYLTLSSTATKKLNEVKINIEMNEVKTDADWEAHSEVSSKYKQISATDVLGKLMNM